MNPRCMLMGIVFSLALGSCSRQPPQADVFTDPARRIRSVERFAGEASVRTARGVETVRVDIRTWGVGGGLTLDELPLPAKGLMIVQLRSGVITTVISGNRQARAEGEFWTVAAGTPMGVQTGDDSAVLQTYVVVPR